MIIIGLMITATSGVYMLCTSDIDLSADGSSQTEDLDATDNSYTGITYIPQTPNTNSDDYSSNNYQYVNVMVTYNGKWSGSLGSVSSSSSYDGAGSQTIKVPNDGSYLFIVSAVIQKHDSGSGTLRIDIVSPTGTVLQTASTSAEYGVVSVSWSQ
jgi:hypothetical protein